MTLQTWTMKCEKMEQLMTKVCKYICSEFNCVYCKMLGKQCVYVVEKCCDNNNNIINILQYK